MTTKAVLTYLQHQNRPFSVNDLVSNLKKEHGKSAIQKALDDLVAQGKVNEKTYGKQKVYCIIQEDENNDPEISKQEMSDMDKKIMEFTELYQNNEQKIKNLEFELKNLKSSLTTEEAKIEKDKLEKQVQKMKDKLKILSENSSPISPEMKQKIEKNHTKYCREYRKRKRICNDILDSILEGYPKKKKDLFEEVGIETDESQNFSLQN